MFTTVTLALTHTMTCSHPPADDAIEAWNPDNKDKMDSRIVGKNNHLEVLRKRLLPGGKKSQVTLIDDSLKNCEIVRFGSLCIPK